MAISDEYYYAMFGVDTEKKLVASNSVSTIEPLKTEEILKKIKAEIESLEPSYNFEGFYKCQSEVIKIIDKAIKEVNE